MANLLFLFLNLTSARKLKASSILDSKLSFAKTSTSGGKLKMGYKALQG
jgi:hypothetical protein